MFRILIIGGNGFIGKSLISLLPNDCIYFAPTSSECNIFDSDSIKSVLSSFCPTHLIHLAWITKNYATATANRDYLLASIHLVKLFYQYGGIRFVGIGSCYEYSPSAFPLKENSFEHPQTLYGKCKLALAHFTEKYALQYHKSWTWCRPFYVTGPGEYSERLVPIACKAFSQNKNFYSSGYYNILDYMDVRDVAAALYKITTSDYCGKINIGSGIPIKVSDILNMIKELYNSSSSIFPTYNSPPSIWVANNDILKNIIKFTPQFSLYSTLKNITSKLELHQYESNFSI